MNILHLEVNDSGGWRRVMSFANDPATLDNVQLRAAYLLMESDSQRIRARIIAPGDTAPVMTWTAADGWKEWRS
ncbi:MAG: hypothetical protein KBG29_01530 [Pseudomonadales bacterium]|nr:hypothetical protein [Pseudomonadales bacterium]